jgi:hypothetical protein
MSSQIFGALAGKANSTEVIAGSLNKWDLGLLLITLIRGRALYFCRAVALGQALSPHPARPVRYLFVVFFQVVPEIVTLLGTGIVGRHVDPPQIS